MYLILAIRPNGRRLLVATAAKASGALEQCRKAQADHDEVLVEHSTGECIDFAELSRRAEAEDVGGG